MVYAKSAILEGGQKMPEVRPLIETGMTALLTKSTIIYTIKKKIAPSLCDHVEILTSAEGGLFI